MCLLISIHLNPSWRKGVGVKHAMTSLYYVDNIKKDDILKCFCYFNPSQPIVAEGVGVKHAMSRKIIFSLLA
jgi:hypothetical protein